MGTFPCDYSSVVAMRGVGWETLFVAIGPMLESVASTSFAPPDWAYQTNFAN